MRNRIVMSSKNIFPMQVFKMGNTKKEKTKMFIL